MYIVVLYSNNFIKSFLQALHFIFDLFQGPAFGLYKHDAQFEAGEPLDSTRWSSPDNAGPTRITNSTSSSDPSP